MRDQQLCNNCQFYRKKKVEMIAYPLNKKQKDYWKCPLCNHIIRDQLTLKEEKK